MWNLGYNKSDRASCVFVNNFIDNVDALLFKTIQRLCIYGFTTLKMIVLIVSIEPCGLDGHEHLILYNSDFTSP